MKCEKCGERKAEYQVVWIEWWRGHRFFRASLCATCKADFPSEADVVEVRPL